MNLLRLVFICIIILTSISAGAQENYRLIIENDTIEESLEDGVLNIPQGTQLLEIQKRDEHGTWQKLKDLNIDISRPFYSEPWFIISVLVLFAVVIFFSLRYYFIRSRKQAIVEAKMMHLERSALRAQMNPHFIFNSLNSIQSYIANNENDKATRFLAKFAKLIRSMLNNSREQSISLQEEIESLKLYLELEKMRFKEKFDFEIIVDDDIDSFAVELPPLLIQPYLENAIIHGLAQKRSQGMIKLYYILDGNYLCVTVTDNGIGVEQSKKMKSKQKSLHKSVGMTVTQKRLEILDKGNKDKKVKIEEIKDRKGEVLGTKVEVKIRIES